MRTAFASYVLRVQRQVILNSVVSCNTALSLPEPITQSPEVMWAELADSETSRTPSPLPHAIYSHPAPNTTLISDLTREWYEVHDDEDQVEYAELMKREILYLCHHPELSIADVRWACEEPSEVADSEEERATPKPIPIPNPEIRPRPDYVI